MRIHWRRYRRTALILLWDKDFTLIGQQRSAECVEPWWRWARRLTGDITAMLLLRRRARHPAYATKDDPDSGRRVLVQL